MSAGHVRIRVKRPPTIHPERDVVGHVLAVEGNSVLVQAHPVVSRAMPSWADVEVTIVDDDDGHETALHGVQAFALNLVEGTDAIVATLRVYEPEVDVDAWALFQDHEALLMVERLIEEIERGDPVPSKLLALARELLEKRQRNAPPER